MFFPPVGIIVTWIVILTFMVAIPLAASQPTGRQRLGPTDQKRNDQSYMVGVYGAMLGLYDDVLDRVMEAPDTLQQALQAPDWLRVSLQQRTRYETLDGRWRAGEQGSDQQVAHRTRLLLYMREIFDPLRGVLELQDSRVHATDADSFVNDLHVNRLDIQQLHLDLATPDLLGTGLPMLFSVGRLNLEIGSNRWIGRNVFRNTTNAFDGVHWLVGGEDQDLTVRAFFVRLVRRLMVTIDPALPDQRNTLWGVYGESRHFDWLNTALYYFGHTSNDAYRDFSMLGMRFMKPGHPGGFEYEIESAYQTGNIGPQSRFEHFHHGEIGYTFDTDWNPQLLVRMDYASSGFDNLYGRRGFELLPTGIFDPFQMSNIVTPGFRFLVLPRQSLYLYVQHRAWWLADATAPWAGANLRDPTGTSGRYLGQTVELRARWGATANLFIQAGYVHFQYGTYVRSVPGGPHNERQSNYAHISAELIF